MRYLISIILVMVITCPATSQVTGAEYFIDSDPGYGNATFTSITSGTLVSKDIVVALSAAAPGFHTLSIRARDAQGSWSHTYCHSFYVTAEPPATIAATEYFVDTDPGTGNATIIPAALSGDSLKYVIPLPAYATGFHTLGLRSRDNTGHWSQTTLHAFYLTESSTPENIIAFQYYFTGPGATDSTYTYTLPSPSPTADINFTAELKQLVGDREYNMHIWAVNAKGARSEVYIKKIKVCSGDYTRAGFDLVQQSRRISLMDSSSHATSYRWNFGDGKTDSVSNPTHTYTAAGNYLLKQVVSNFCNSDSISRTIDIVGLQSVFPNRGGNNGTVTLTLSGAGFSAASKVKLVNGATTITGDTAFINQDGTGLQVTFNLRNQPIGTYDLIAYNSSNGDTLKKGFSVEQSIAPKMSVQIEGRNNIRSGRLEKYEITVNNAGNQDAIFVPLWLTVPKDVSAKFGFDIYRRKNPAINFDSIPIGMVTDTLFGNPVDSTVLYYFIIPRVAANASFTCNVYLTTTVFKDQEFAAYVFPPMVEIDSNIAGRAQAGISYTNVANFLGCIKQAIKDAIDPFCTKDASDVAQTLRQLPCSGDNYFKAVLSEDRPTVECDAGTNSLRDLVAKPVIEGGSYLVKCLTGAVIGMVGRVGEFISHVLTAKDIAVNSKGCFDPFLAKLAGLKKLILHTVAANDPNEKLGPIGNTIANYNKGEDAFNYKIYFENKSSATAAAQEVQIIDTLDATKFDLATFQLQSYGYGDSVKKFIPAGLSEYFTVDTLRRPGKPTILVKVDAKLNPQGILTWRFLSLDPQTRELLSDPLDGFLPPNVTAPQGQGYIAYAVKPKAALTHGTQVKNKAVIYFDNNAPITTNEFLNTLDKTNPASTISSLPAEVYDTTFTVQWSGTDNGSGIRNYDIYYKINNGPYKVWKFNTSISQFAFTGQQDSTYSFFSISKDFAGNIEPSKVNADGVVTIKLVDTANRICPGGNTSFTVPTQAGAAYQWQVDQGAGFTDIGAGGVYSGTQTKTLTLTAPATTYSNYKYRCRLTNGSTITYSNTFTVKFVNTWLGTNGSAWETASNWSCGTIPDANTEVIIPKLVPASPVINLNATCKRLTMSKESNLQIKTGVQLLITGKTN